MIMYQYGSILARFDNSVVLPAYRQGSPGYVIGASDSVPRSRAILRLWFWFASTRE